MSAAVRTRAYRDGAVLAEGFPVVEVSEYLADPRVVVWVDFCAPVEADLVELADELGLHDLAVEDALSPHQRPKVDYYDTHLFLSSHVMRLDPGTGVLGTTEIDAFVNSRWLVTVRKDDSFALDPVLQRWDRSVQLIVHGGGFLLYGLLDVIIDSYFELISQFDDYYDTVSEALFSDTPLKPSGQQMWFEMRRSLVRFHRLVVPMREAISGLMRREHHAVDEAIYPYFQDVYDHVLRVTESTDALRDLVSTIVETNLSLRDYRQNQVMKMVTSWAAIIALPTLITGFYGMNVPFPGNGRPFGVVMAVGLIVVLSVALYLVFRRRKWL